MLVKCHWNLIDNEMFISEIRYIIYIELEIYVTWKYGIWKYIIEYIMIMVQYG